MATMTPGANVAPLHIKNTFRISVVGGPPVEVNAFSLSVTEGGALMLLDSKRRPFRIFAIDRWTECVRITGEQP